MAVVKKVAIENKQGTTTRYDVGALAQNVVYDSNNSVKDKIDNYENIIPSNASSSNQLLTEDDLPGAATSSALGLVKPDNTTITVDGNGVISSSATGGTDLAKTRYTITATNWSNSPDADGYYTYTITLSPILDTTVSPDVLIAGSSNTSQPTDTHKTMFSYVERCYLSGSTLTLYAKTKPTSDFYIWVEGVNGTGSSDIVGNIIKPNEISGGDYSTAGLIYANCSYVAGGYFKIGNVAFINIRIKCTDASSNRMIISGFPTYTNKTVNLKNIVPVASYNMTDEVQTVDYCAINQGGQLDVRGTLITDKEYAFMTSYLCD